MCAICACSGGAVQFFDVTPTNEIYKWSSNEYSPLGVHWYNPSNFKDLAQLKHHKQQAINEKKIFAFTLNG